MNGNKWFPVMGWAVKVQPGSVSVSHFDGFMWAADKNDARLQMIERTKNRLSPDDGFIGHEVIVLDYPEFTITKN